MTGITAWLKEIGLEKYADAFRSNDIDFDVLPALGPDELKELGVSLGDRPRLLKAIAARSGPARRPRPRARPPRHRLRQHRPHWLQQHRPHRRRSRRRNGGS
jgi:hypothetical protein